MTNELKPVLTEGQWERILTTEDIPELEVDATLGFLAHKLGWFTWGDAFEHRRIGEMMEVGVKELGVKLAEMGSIKDDPKTYFEFQKQYQRIKEHQRWHYDMANRIAALLPPPPLLERLHKEREANESEGMEESDPGGEGSAGDSGDSGGGARPGPVEDVHGEGQVLPGDSGQPGPNLVG